MATQRFSARDIKGLTPAVVPTVSEELFALNGKNFIFDTRGPKSSFGNRLLLPQQRTRPDYIQGFRLKLRTGDRCFTIDGDGIWEWDEAAGGFKSIYLTPDTTQSPYRWTHGYLNGYMFFAHPRTGILAYNLDTGICQPHSNIGKGTPVEVLAIVVNNGRLIAIGPNHFSWSNPSNGLDFTPALGGAGAQLVSDRVPGSPIMVTSYTRGCLTWTTGGVMRSEFTGDSAVYRHRSLNTEYHPVNSFCTCRIDDDTVIILDERGLFKSRGEAPEPYAPMFNEFLLDYIQKYDLRIGNNLRVEWDELQRLMYISTSLSYADAKFESCFVLYPPLDKWGQFNEPHYGVLPLLIKDSERSDDYYGFVDADARIRYWLATGSREKRPEESASLEAGNLYYPAIQKPAQFPDELSGVTLSSSGKANTIAKNPITKTAGYYQTGVVTPIVPELIGLGAKIQFGMFRPTGSQASDEMSEVLNVLIRNVESGNEDQLGVDFNLIPSATDDEDYNLGTGAEDYGYENLNYINHGFRMISTIDGSSEFASTVPSLIGFVKGARHYSCSILGIWHIAEISAEEVGESFHLQTFEITAASAGRLM